MATTRSVDFLPPIFQTQTNKQFLSATLDQLIQEPAYQKTQGFIGRRVGPGVTPDQNYVQEPDATRQNYQLEPGILRVDPGDSKKIIDAITYPGIGDALAVQGAFTNNADRLYTSEYYTWDPFVNLDKFVNYGQYYWLPNGPDAVDVSASSVPFTDDIVVTRTETGYTFSGYNGVNPTVTLARQGSYTFRVNQPGFKFWIQAFPGTSGVVPLTPNISSRTVLGVTNNGDDVGTITFNVPTETEQQFFYDLPSIGTVDLVTTLQFEQIQGKPVVDFTAEFGGIDGITNLDGRTLIFANATVGDPTKAIWLVDYVDDGLGNEVIDLSLLQEVSNLQKFNIRFGTVYASTGWYKNSSGQFQQIPLLTAALDSLYYQDSASDIVFGRIDLIQQSNVNPLNISDIVGKKTYTSPNGVVFTNGLKVIFRGPTLPSSYTDQTYYVAGVGTAIQLLPVENYITPEPYTNNATIPYDSTPYDDTPFDGALNQPMEPDYIVMAIDSPDLNAWARTNRWFHIDVITASAEYNNTIPQIDNLYRAKRPILEYRGGTRLFNMGTQAKQPVNIVDFTTEDALSTVNGATGYSIDGYSFINGTRVIFAADRDPAVRNKIYQVEFIEPNSDGSTIPDPIINLVPADDGTVLADQCVVCINGNTLQGKSFWFNGLNWIGAQNKTQLNQAPLFDVFDSNGFSFSNIEVYPSSNFAGSKLFSYAVGNGIDDPVLNFPLKYLTLANVGDIVFDNNLYNDSFIYTVDSTSTTKRVSDGFVRQYSDRTTYTNETGWQTAVTASNIYQQFSFEYVPGTPLRLDVAAKPIDTVPSIKVFVENQFQDPGTYSYTVGPDYTDVTLSASIPAGVLVEILVLSDQSSTVGFYQVPINLENNPFNINSATFTLGTVRTHYETIAENLIEFQGKINGANNTRDLGNILPYGLNILQQSSPLTLAGYFARSQQYNIWSAIQYNSQEYEKFKAQLLNIAVTNDYSNLSVAEILTQAIADLNTNKTDINSFYWSDMLPHGSNFTQTVYNITPISTNVFDTINTYNYTSANFQGLLVYYNTDTLLIRGQDYEVGVNSPTITVNIPLQTGDVITIQEYNSTYGSFVPNTPTKLGLYPAFKPEIYLDTTYVNPTFVIRGHDGSITVAFGDFRDQLLLQFETRIYNNLKLDGNPVPLTAVDVVPGQFRTTDYSLNEINNILAKDFLTWSSWNKLNYKKQDYTSNQFTWNYKAASNRLSSTNQPLGIGAWRGLYNYFYDTCYPDTRPWEMLGFSQEPDWWQIEYGPAPYTSNNLVLWDDLEQGIVKDPNGPYILPQYARPGLTSVIPVGTEGQLLSPMESVVGNYDSNTFKTSWIFGDDGPVENAWRTSSSYPFAVMRLLSLTRPAEFFALFADRDLYKFDTTLNQYLYNQRYRLDANGIQIYGNGVSKASYINWIVDYNKTTGVDTTNDLTVALSNLDVRLCYRMASFSSKSLIQIYAERSSPSSVNSSLLLPDESYNLLFYKNVPFASFTYSSIIVQVVNGGYAVYGFSTTNPYFEILASQINGVNRTITVENKSVVVPTTYTDQVVKIPYGYTFTNLTAVSDFLLSYGEYLKSQGVIFNSVENGYVLNWDQMVSEFLYWSQQGWAEGSVINLNPGATRLVIERPFAVVDDITVQTQEQQILNQDFKPLNSRNLIVDRDGNKFTVESITGETINLLSVKFVTFEHMIVFDNVSIFADLIYDPATGARQSRLQFAGSTTSEWNGQLNAPGFLLNENNINEWRPGQKYAKGEIVIWKNNYYSANTIVQPSVTFNINDWAKSDYTRIQQGLLPNLANKSDQLANTYSVYNANLERDQDLLAYGLIGFRPRQYMAALNLDDVSQVNLYRQFLPIKGTIRAAEIFKFANLGRGLAEFDIFENWAVLRATYGANANRSYYDLRLNEALLPFNPSIIQVTLPQQTSQADQTVLVDNIWKSSYKITTPNILTTTLSTTTDTALPNAGYVNFEDVDITVFDINDPASINANIDNIKVGSTVWAAKINNYNWGVFRADQVTGKIVSLRSSLNGTSVFTFTLPHGLTQDDLLIVKFFNDTVNGTYRILSVPDIFSVVVAYTFENPQQIQILGEGIGFKLSTQRVSQASDVINLPYTNDIFAGAKVWVDDDGTGHWQVLEKTDIFSSGGLLLPASQATNSQYGHAVSQANENLFAFVGAPGYNSGSGIVYSFVKTSTNGLGFNSPLELSATDVVGFGYSVDIGNQTYVAVGAPESGSNLGYVAVIYRIPSSQDFFVQQLLLPPANDLGFACEFGYSVDVSDDERWIYVGAPGVNKVYAFGLVEIQNQSVKYITDGFTNSFNYSDKITIDNAYPEQISVVLNNQLLTYGVDYTQTATDIIFSAPVVKDLVLQITRRTSVNFIGDGTTDTFSVNDFLFTATSLDAFKVEVNGILQRPNIDYEFLSNAGDIFFFTPPPLDAVVVATSGSYFSYVDEISYKVEFNGTISGTTLTVNSVSNNGSDLIVGMKLAGNGVDPNTTIIGLGTGTGGVGTYIVDVAQTIGPVTMYARLPEVARFGTTVNATTDGQQIIVTAPGDRTADVISCGSAYLFNRSVEAFVVTTPGTTDFTIAGPTLQEPTSVSVNGVFLTNSQLGDNGEFTVVGNTIELETAPNVGDLVEVGVNTFNFMQKIVADNPIQAGGYGQAADICSSNCSFFVGAPTTSEVDGNRVVKSEVGSVYRLVNQSRVYGTITSNNPNPSLTAGHTICINNVEVAVPAAPNNTVAGLAAAINSAEIPNAQASVGAAGTINAGRLTVSVINLDAADPLNKLTVTPGQIGTAFSSLGFTTFVQTQIILPPVAFEFGRFGASLARDFFANNLIVGAPRSTIVKATTFDSGTTYFDGRTTTFTQRIVQSGAAYTYDFLASSSLSVATPGKFVFGQQLTNNFVQSLDQFGSSVSYRNGIALVGAPGHDTDDSSGSELNFGSVNIFRNPSESPAWLPIRIQQPVVDINLVNNVYSYDRITSAKTTFFDFFDPLQGKILGSARQNIDYIGAIDPAFYNTGSINNVGKLWGSAHVGEIWWDTNTVRFIDTNQDDIVYAARRWGQVFPGSRIDVYQWVESSVPPSQYSGPGNPRSTDSYVVTSVINDQGFLITNYYFWVRNISSINSNKGKTLSPVGIARYIEDPRSSGIPYVAFLSASATAIFNAKDEISAQDTILSIEFDRQYTDDTVHTQYDLIPQDRANGFLPDVLYRKLIDSFCGVDAMGNLVPDPFLPEALKYGVQFRPRQSMFIDRFAALRNYIGAVNRILLDYPISESRSLSLLQSKDPEPPSSSGAWNKRVANLEELSYQMFTSVPVGYKYLVQSDSRQDGLWTIYEVTAPKTFDSLALVAVQTYDTNQYWNYVDWYLPGYNSSQIPVAEVTTFNLLQTLNVPVGSSVKVTANAQGKFEIYLLTDIGWERVALQDGTIQILPTIWDYSLGKFGFDQDVFDNQGFDPYPAVETRQIIRSINEQLLIGELLLERNRVLTLMFNFVLTEQAAPEWLTKTSLIDVDHKIRSLEPFQIYRADNQDFVVDYIQEVKPYHVQVRELNLIYDKLDVYDGSLTDFDLPAYYNTDLVPPKFVSPVLTPYTLSQAEGTGISNTDSDTPPSSALWQTFPYNQWYSNYLLEVESVVIVNPGAKYNTAPVVTVVGDCITPATIVARINTAGLVIAFDIVDPGEGYSETAVLVISGGGLPENAAPWQSNTAYESGVVVVTAQNNYYISVNSGTSSGQPPSVIDGQELNGSVLFEYLGTNAKAYAVMGNSLVRSIKTTIKYDRYQYTSNITNWTANATYTNGDLVRYLDQVWEASNTDSTEIQNSEFDPEQWTLVPAADLSGVNRTQGYYTPGVNEPGLSLGQLIDGIDYPGVQIDAPDFDQNTGFDVGNFDINPFDNIAFGPEGLPTYDPGILDTIYQSFFGNNVSGPVPTGTAVTDINVDGGGFVDAYSSHAPEELVPGAEFDTLDLRVFTTPGADWENNGHGFAWKTIKWVYDSSAAPAQGFENVLPVPVQVLVTNQTQRRDLALGIDYSVDWGNFVVELLPRPSAPPAANGDVIVISVFGLGGGNQLLLSTGFNGAEIGDQYTLPIDYNQIEEMAVFVNGELITGYTLTELPTGKAQLDFSTTYTSNDFVCINAIGVTAPGIEYSWSTPITQYYVADGGLNFVVDAYFLGTNPANMIVEIDGIRARPPQGACYTADGSTAYQLPVRGGYSQALISNNEVQVWVNNEPQILGVDFTVEPYVSEENVREVIFNTAPSIGADILISVTTRADYTFDISTGTLTFRTSGGFYPILGDIVSITTWNDTSQQGICTLLWQGPVISGGIDIEPYDSEPFDIGVVSGLPGTYDYSAGTEIIVNNFQLGRTIADPSRLWVTKNGERLFYGDDYLIVGEELVIHGPAISVTDVVVATLFTDSVVPGALAFRIFQDMREVQATYRITPSTTTYLVQPLSDTDDVIYVFDATALTIPNLAANIWGVLTVDGERIMYRNIDFVTNTVSGLRRGTYGTATDTHSIGTPVYNIGRGNLLPLEYQDRVVFSDTLADGTTVTFTANNIDLSSFDTDFAEQAIMVHVGGTRQIGNYTVDSVAPATVTFDTAPGDGIQVTISVRQGQSWYEPGGGNPSNGIALQLQTTDAADFFRGN